MTSEYRWVVYDMTRRASENPAFGPMTEAEADALIEKLKGRNPHAYWKARIHGRIHGRNDA